MELSDPATDGARERVEALLTDASSSPRLVVIAASAGSLGAIIEVLAPLPADFPAAIAIVQHRGPKEPERLVEILAARTRLRVCHAVDGDALKPGTVYVCPPGVHMTAEHCLRLTDGPKLRYVQPNADLMFESVSRTYGERALGVVLSGCGSDAAMGSHAITHAGGAVVAQDDRSCAFPSMPQNAVNTGAVEQMLTPAEIARALGLWATGREPGKRSEQDRETGDAVAPIRVLLVDDHRIVLDGLRVMLDSEPDLTVVAEAEDGAAAIRAAEELSPDVVVMDIRMPGVGGVEATRQILARRPGTKVVVLSADTDAHVVDAILHAGATGYLSKQLAYRELVQAIRTVMEGKVYLTREVARMVTTGEVMSPVTARPPGL